MIVWVSLSSLQLLILISVTIYVQVFVDMLVHIIIFITLQLFFDLLLSQIIVAQSVLLLSDRDWSSEALLVLGLTISDFITRGSL